MLVSAGVQLDENLQLMQVGSMMRKVKSRSWKKQRYFKLQEDCMTIWYKSKKTGNTKSTCELSEYMNTCSKKQRTTILLCIVTKAWKPNSLTMPDSILGNAGGASRQVHATGLLQGLCQLSFTLIGDTFEIIQNTFDLLLHPCRFLWESITSQLYMFICFYLPQSCKSQWICPSMVIGVVPKNGVLSIYYKFHMGMLTVFTRILWSIIINITNFKHFYLK